MAALFTFDDQAFSQGRYMTDRIIAIDPGTTHSAYLRWENGEIVFADKVANELVLERLSNPDRALDTILIEWITSYGMRVGAEVFETCRWVGKFQMACADRAILIPRREVKMWHCGRPSVKDADIIGALKEKYGDKGTKAAPGLTYPLKGDTWQAFALATFWSEKNQVAQES